MEVVEGRACGATSACGCRACSRARHRVARRMKAASEGLRIPIDVQDGGYKIAPRTCILWDSIGEAKNAATRDFLQALRLDRQQILTALPAGSRHR